MDKNRKLLSDKELHEFAEVGYMSEDGLELDSDDEIGDPNFEDVSDYSSEEIGDVEAYLLEMEKLQNKHENKENEEGNEDSTIAENRQKKKVPKQKTQWAKAKEQNISSVPVCDKKHEVNIKFGKPIEYFNYFFTQEFLQEIVYQSNLYAVQNGKLNFQLSLPELRATYLGIVIVISYIKYPRVRHYWSSESGLRMDLIANAMTCNRFEEIRRYLHFKDTSDIPENNDDKLIRIRPVIHHLHNKFHSAVTPEEHMSVDEMMIPFKGFSSIKQYLPKKPKKWGFKIWVRAGSSGYVYCFEPFQGAAKSKESISELGSAGDVVMRLCHDITGSNYKIYADNYFSSVALIRKMKNNKIWYLGTVRNNRLDGAEKKLDYLKMLKQKGRGSSSAITSTDGITIVRWFNNNIVHTISNFATVRPLDEVQRFCRKEKKYVTISRPFSIQLYNKHMGGVDLMDSLVALYQNYMRNKRWYMRLFYHFLNVTLVNAWLIWRINEHEKMDLLEFKSRIATALIFQGDAKKKRAGRPSKDTPPRKQMRTYVPIEKRLDGGNHFPEKSEPKFASRCKNPKCTRKTSYLCSRCLMALCPECFEDYHTK